MLRQLIKESWLFKSGIIALIAGLMAFYMGLAGDKAPSLNALQVQSATINKVANIIERRKRSTVHEWFELTTTQNNEQVVWRINSPILNEKDIHNLIDTPVNVWLDPDNDNEIYQIEAGEKILLAYKQTHKYHRIKTLEDLYLAYFMFTLGTLMMGAAAMLLRQQAASNV